MREVLFRGKRSDTGEWVYGYYSVDTICSIDGEYLAPVIRPVPKQVYDDTWNEILPDTVCEYTGLNDCNGKKIFEGDILSFQHPFQNRHGIYIVSFISGGFNCEKFYQSHFDNPCDAFSEGTEYFKVIGNIYDAPELLKGSENE